MKTLMLVTIVAVVSFSGCQGGRTERAYRPYVGGDVEAGQVLFFQKGCAACHSLDESEARGRVGPPLDDFVRRTYIAGNLPNNPRNLVQWLLDPPAIDPGTAMPNLNLSLQEARDLAAYIYEQD